MGQITTALLDTLRIPWKRFLSEPGEVITPLQHAVGHFRQRSLPYALVMPCGAVSYGRPRPDRDGAPIGRRELALSEALTRPYRERCARADALGALQAAATQHDVIVATTGYTSRELYKARRCRPPAVPGGLDGQR